MKKTKSEGIASNLRTYINGFSPRARDIFEKFDFDSEIEKLDESNRIYTKKPQAKIG